MAAVAPAVPHAASDEALAQEAQRIKQAVDSAELDEHTIVDAWERLRTAFFNSTEERVKQEAATRTASISPDNRGEWGNVRFALWASDPLNLDLNPTRLRRICSITHRDKAHAISSHHLSRIRPITKKYGIDIHVLVFLLNDHGIYTNRPLCTFLSAAARQLGSDIRKVLLALDKAYSDHCKKTTKRPLQAKTYIRTALTRLVPERDWPTIPKPKKRAGKKQTPDDDDDDIDSEDLQDAADSGAEEEEAQDTGDKDESLLDLSDDADDWDPARDDTDLESSLGSAASSSVSPEIARARPFDFGQGSPGQIAEDGTDSLTCPARASGLSTPEPPSTSRLPSTPLAKTAPHLSSIHESQGQGADPNGGATRLARSDHRQPPQHFSLADFGTETTTIVTPTPHLANTSQPVHPPQVPSACLSETPCVSLPSAVGTRTRRQATRFVVTSTTPPPALHSVPIPIVKGGNMRKRVKLSPDIGNPQLKRSRETHIDEHGDVDSVAVMYSSEDLQRSLSCLDPERCLEDPIVNTILRGYASPSAVILSTFFLFSKSQTDRARKTWAQPQQLARCDKILIPVCQQYHWVLYVWETSRARLSVYDSLQSFNVGATTLPIVVKRLRWLLGDAHPKRADSNEILLARCPQQTGRYDCGVMLLLFAKYLSSQQPIPAEIPYTACLEYRHSLRKQMDDVIQLALEQVPSTVSVDMTTDHGLATSYKNHATQTHSSLLGSSLRDKLGVLSHSWNTAVKSPIKPHPLSPLAKSLLSKSNSATQSPSNNSDAQSIMSLFQQRLRSQGDHLGPRPHPNGAPSDKDLRQELLALTERLLYIKALAAGDTDAKDHQALQRLQAKSLSLFRAKAMAVNLAKLRAMQRGASQLQAMANEKATRNREAQQRQSHHLVSFLKEARASWRDLSAGSSRDSGDKHAIEYALDDMECHGRRALGIMDRMIQANHASHCYEALVWANAMLIIAKKAEEMGAEPLERD
ncbi:hypothetical protein B0H67DRAFT_595058 [Lasiosphaeris hirsuta]|uniref:Ubiquitin-like protease family profile domain-containing protein n=1 Tax=Lasiosphaeris hirsuta TaxID=260670 RepID=A0AA39ZS94_9PEZI|nr:hypothetical protein B0H67DRAFT_595058 [Lasiosphaeris hirsuta]